MKQKLSVIIIAGNEASHIADCLKSCRWADQVILVAANSSDSTVDIALKIFPHLKVIKINDEYGRHFAKWRNLGLKLATSDWVFYLDADERITSKLKHEILFTINSPLSSNKYFVVPRANYYLGKRVRYGGSYPDYVKRLFPRLHLCGWQGNLHEEPIIDQSLSYLHSDLLHLTHRDLSSMLQKTLIWTQTEAKALFESGHPPIFWWRFFRMMVTTFFHRFIVQQSWRDGTVGYISVIFEMFDTFIIYARLYELQQLNHS